MFRDPLPNILAFSWPPKLSLYTTLMNAWSITMDSTFN
jgi:hypothetical protein